MSAAKCPPNEAESAAGPELIPAKGRQCELRIGGRQVRLTNLHRPFWPELGITKAGLLRYYTAVAPFLLPHLKDRAMVMKRYPNGWKGKHFFMKRTPEHAPQWLNTCAIEHGSGSVIDFPLVQNLASLLWVVNLGAPSPRGPASPACARRRCWCATAWPSSPTRRRVADPLTPGQVRGILSLRSGVCRSDPAVRSTTPAHEDE